jgi:hypothetical protein
MEYCLGAGDGSATMWDRGPDLDLDGDGRLDAVSLDFDGDGLADDALADFDGDGIADHAVLDLDNDGTAESYFTDDGSGTWSVATDSPPARRDSANPRRDCAGSGSTASSTPMGRWLTSTPTASPKFGCSTATATGWPTAQSLSARTV